MCIKDCNISGCLMYVIVSVADSIQNYVTI